MRTLSNLATLSLAAVAAISITACSAKEYEDPVTGVSGVIITGDDGQVITASNLEDALKKAKEALKKAEAANDKTGIADWKYVIAKIIEEKQDIGEPIPEDDAPTPNDEPVPDEEEVPGGN